MAHLYRRLASDFLFLKRGYSRYKNVRLKVEEDELKIGNLLQKYLFEGDWVAFVGIKQICDTPIKTVISKSGEVINYYDVELQEFLKKLKRYEKVIMTNKEIRTTNRLEGLNSQIRDNMRTRRGLQIESAISHYAWWSTLWNLRKQSYNISPLEMHLGRKLRKEPSYEDIMKEKIEIDGYFMSEQEQMKSILSLYRSD